MQDGIYAKINTTKGDILLELTYDKTPGTVGNFVALAEGKLENTAKPKDIPYIFHPFFSTKHDRVGISLAVVKRIMDIHGGCVKVTSKQGEGATVFLMFPLERRRPIRVSLFG